ncbi:MAG: chemotaxis protein CheD [Beijerinckiaceae bacterium]
MIDLAPTEKRDTVLQGEFRVSHDPHVVCSTILGSCVAACITDPNARIGGMNHFLLPGASVGGQDDERYGVHLMELLINGLMSNGAKRDRLEAKLFGGATMLAGLGDIGERNALFARKFLEYEGIKIVNSDLGGSRGRRIQFWPTTGRVRLAYLGANAISEERRVKSPPNANSGEFESFT